MTAVSSLESDSAAETLDGHGVYWEPPGPNTPLAQDANGNQLFPGPGDNAYIDRPTNCVAQTVSPSAEVDPRIGGGSNPPAARTDTGASAPAGTSTIRDDAIVATDAGRTVSGSGIPAGAYVGKVTDTSNSPDIPNGGSASTACSRSPTPRTTCLRPPPRRDERHARGTHRGDRPVDGRHGRDQRRR